MGKERASLGFGDELDSFDPAEWPPGSPNSANTRPELDQTKRAARAAGFESREPDKAEVGSSKPQRRRRTGRNVQFNIKARRETIDAFCAIADDQGWGLGETLEHAVLLLMREYHQ